MVMHSTSTWKRQSSAHKIV